MDFDEDQGLQKRFPALAKRDRRESGENCTFQHSVRTFGDLWYVPHFELDGQQFFAVEGSCRSRPAHEELDGQQFFAIEGSCRRKISKWKSRAQVVRELPQVPQGTTASTTPPFVRAGYDCRNSTTVLRRPEAAGWAPLVCAGPLTTSLRGLWVSGLLPPGNGGTNEGAATQKPTSVRRNSRSNLGARGGTREPWRRGATYFLQVVAATAGGTERAPLAPY